MLFDVEVLEFVKNWDNGFLGGGQHGKYHINAIGFISF